jgi:hypothetical protein
VLRPSSGRSLGAGVVRHVGNAGACAHGAYKQQPSRFAGREFLAEVVGDFEMCERVEPQVADQQVSILAEEQTGARAACIGYDQPDVEILGRGGKGTGEAFDRRSASTTRYCTPNDRAMSAPTVSSRLPRLAASTTLMPDAATYLVNSLPMPDDAPVTSAQGPNCVLLIVAGIAHLPGRRHLFRESEADQQHGQGELIEIMPQMIPSPTWKPHAAMPA